jgi:hypothetical protein
MNGIRRGDGQCGLENDSDGLAGGGGLAA